MYLKLFKQFTICLAILLSLTFCQENHTAPKDSSIATSQTHTRTTGSQSSSAPAPYQAPRSVTYPFGDESMINNDMLNASAASEANCAEENEFIEYKPECTGPVDGTDELYVSCLKTNVTNELTDTIYSSAASSTLPFPMPSLVCKSCDLQKNAENTAVIISCVHCFEYENPSNRTAVNLTCAANYLEIKNYTKPQRIMKQF